ncbi:MULTISPECIES: amylo-alpha-1,6-glucosidase [unclassified Leptolyngbya]|uniref:amylo-alpha-1,6-glucosidase n=1 Tax=unclassified Leptolyngbya TaxID=2650499 RepID=UPI00168618E7|nr:MULTISPECIES: amylo-alpha-1,6-glucosidase [unclassified Leptolyngbya]MBD1910354.1 glycogen debranching enzyme family protein [Leptolyngbya sp. FACHB-8]MBD2154843.1 glycogen debranching enzyme family protein [Leptolyngbya sp. FACHB-16]
MKDFDTREWLLTNGLGSFASGTIADAHTRTYHGWLIAAIAPPGRRTLLLSHIDAVLSMGGQPYELSTHLWGSGAIAPVGYGWLQSFSRDPVPTWIWGDDTWQLTRQIVMPCSNQATGSDGAPILHNGVLVQYQYQGPALAVLTLRPLIGDRNFHSQQIKTQQLHFSQVVESQRVIFQACLADELGTSWQLSWNRGQYMADPNWYYDYSYPEEKKRGLGDREDLYNPGYLTVPLKPGEAITVQAVVRSSRPFVPVSDTTFAQALETEQTRLNRSFPAVAPTASPLLKRLLKAGDQFIAYRSSIQGPTIIAGYPWFSDWGRDTLIALPGLALATGRYELARGLLRTFGMYCHNGLIPNTFPDGDERPAYNSIDAALWWIETLGLYLEATQDWDFLAQQYPVVQQIYKRFMVGTAFNIRVDASDGLVTWETPGVALTWMDAVVEGQPMTPRQGKAIEINALWYSALCWADRWAEQLQQGYPGGEPPTNFGNHVRRYRQQALQVRASLQQFWNADAGYFYDLIAPNDERNAQIRPNAILALSLEHCGFPADQARQALLIARDRLLTPYGLRSLDPSDPEYQGRYEGGVWERDRAYHQGTVWSWLIGPFIRAWKRYFPEEPLPWSAKHLLYHFEQDACLDSISEIFDGDAPHEARGAIAQAWSVAELIRHWDDVIEA